MPKIILAVAGDTLCTLAIRAGFLDCEKLRAEAANSAFLNRPLLPGDKVTIPEIKITSLSKAVEKLHQFVRKGVPTPAIRLVHGSRDKPYRDDDTLTFLNISNFISNLGGDTGQSAFPTGFGFDALGHADPDSFKVEVVDPSGGAEVNVTLEALKPLHAADGSVSGHEPFTDAQAGLRKLKVTCKKVSNSNFKGYRSRYLRLVSDEEDAKVLSAAPPRTDGSAQGLFCSDMADGNNGPEDRVEILDQLVRATYVIKGCKASAPNQCKVVVELPLAPDRQRLRLCFHLFRSAVGSATGVGGVTPQNLRRRTFKWYRRAYAQAGLAPKLVDPFIEMIDPPAANMLVISNDHGNVAAGGSTLSFSLDLSPGDQPAPRAHDHRLAAAIAAAPIPVTINLTAGHTPDQVAAEVVAALPAGFAGAAFSNAPAFNAVNGSADILITRTDGKRVILRSEATTDTSLTVTVARVDLNSVDSNHPGNSLIPASVGFRRVIRAAPGTDDRMDCYVIGQFITSGLRGRAFVPATDLPAAFQPPSPLRWAAVMAATSSSGAVMDGSDNLPFTYPHESGHVLTDAFHTTGTGGNTELMSGSGTSQANSVTATKRICDDPVHVKYQMFQPQPAASTGAATEVAISAVDRLRTRGAPVFEGW